MIPSAWVDVSAWGYEVCERWRCPYVYQWATWVIGESDDDPYVEESVNDVIQGAAVDHDHHNSPVEAVALVTFDANQEEAVAHDSPFPDDSPGEVCTVDTPIQVD